MNESPSVKDDSVIKEEISQDKESVKVRDSL
jgi:hypothetical protein